ncbi:hypothetical protein BCON_0265g00160 [Botryotinia convoluta]|uniref:2EXR domain-containing protein n=1 Tax=Botryotinia convoluta TaxID=54673 RepID=A0A4Z1HRZ1_9HELO|nr:hypothetical protein BCON_0265g00160 [Botryotinia convoluta]
MVRRSRGPTLHPARHSRLPIKLCTQCRSSHSKSIPFSNSESVKASPRFHQFSLLPLEIQREVWTFAAASAAEEERIIPIVVHWTPISRDKDHNGWYYGSSILLTPISIIPPLLHTCSFSRSLALPGYRLVGMADIQSQSCLSGDIGLDYPVFEPKHSGTGVYINPKKDMIYFTQHDVFDAKGNQHFPGSEAHAGDYSPRNPLHRPKTCRPCSFIEFPVVFALRLLIGDMDIRKELRNIGFSFDVPVKRHFICWGGLNEDFSGLRRIVFVSEEKSEKRLLRNGTAHGTNAATSTSIIPKLTTPSPHIRNKCFETYKERFHKHGTHMQNGREYMMTDAREQFFRPLINRAIGPNRTGPGTGRNWLQWGIHGLVPFGWKGTGAGEEWEEDGGPRVEFLVEDGKDRNRATRDIFLV